MGYGFGLMGFGMIIPLILIGLTVYAVVRISQDGNRNHSNGYKSENNALDILNRRYANGEISDEEYNQKKKVLKEK